MKRRPTLINNLPFIIDLFKGQNISKAIIHASILPLIYCLHIILRIFRILDNINSHILSKLHVFTKVKNSKTKSRLDLTNFNLVMLTRQAQSTPQMKRWHANIEEIFPFFFRVTFILKALPPLHLYPASQLRLSFWRKKSDTTPTIISHVSTHFGVFRNFLGFLPTN